MQRIKRIDITQLAVGMYITPTNNDWIPEGNSTRSGLIKSEKVIGYLVDMGVKEVHIDADKGLDAEGGYFIDPSNAIRLSEKNSNRSFAPRVSIVQETQKASKIRSQSLSLVNEIMNKVKNGEAVQVEQVDELAGDVMRSLERNQNALLCLSQIRSKDNYLLEHSCNVGLLAGMLGRAIGVADNIIQDLITAGMLHDIGKIGIADEILHKPGKLEASEWDEMKRHVEYGVKALNQTEGVTEIAKFACAQHHERLDGTGYPNGLKGDEINWYAKIVAVADVYDAISADRVYHRGLPPAVCLKRLLEWSDDHLDRGLVQQLARALGVYPVGSLLELDNEKLAVVVDSNSQHPDKPVVKVVYHGKYKRFLEVLTVDLARSRKFSISKVVDPLRYGIRVGDFL